MMVEDNSLTPSYLYISFDDRRKGGLGSGWGFVASEMERTFGGINLFMQRFYTCSPSSCPQWFACFPLGPATGSDIPHVHRLVRFISVSCSLLSKFPQGYIEQPEKLVRTATSRNSHVIHDHGHFGPIHDTIHPLTLNALLSGHPFFWSCPSQRTHTLGPKIAQDPGITLYMFNPFCTYV